MKKSLFALLLLALFSSALLAQRIKMSESELMNKLDSVLQEGNLLYKYEKSAWISNDLAFENPIVRAEFKDYLTYEEQGEIRTIILGENHQVCIAEYVFEYNFDNPKSIKIEKRELSDKERTLIDVRKKIIDNTKDKKYKVTVPKGYDLNFILLPFADKYKLYIITGTTNHDVVPFGNDYIFIADKNGKIESWHKFHSRLIPAYVGVNNAVGLFHTHLRRTPLMTATDICIFMLYAPLCNLETLVIMSDLGTMSYSLKVNKIAIQYFR